MSGPATGRRASPARPPPGARYRRRRRIGRAALLALAALLAVEIGLRSLFGLGRPLLFVEHPRMEYVPAPNQRVVRFGNTAIYNASSMRSATLGERADRRVLVLGDSVVNGGSFTDQRALATAMLNADAGGVWYGNASAGSWGPANLLGWIDTFGLEGIEAAIVVLSGYDWLDVPRFAPMDPATHPLSRPRSAIREALYRYGPRLRSAGIAEPFRPRRREHRFADHAPSATVTNASDSLRDIVERTSRAGVRLCVILHVTKRGRGKTEADGLRRIRRLFGSLDVPTHDLGPSLRAAAAEGIDPYRDEMHLNEHGQTILARAVRACDAEATVPAPL